MAAATGRIRIRSSQMSHHPCWTANHRRQLLHTDWGSLPRERTKQQPAAAFLGLGSIFDSSILPTSLAHVSSPSPTAAAVRVGSWCAWSERQLSRLRRKIFCRQGARTPRTISTVTPGCKESTAGAWRLFGDWRDLELCSRWQYAPTRSSWMSHSPSSQLLYESPNQQSDALL